MSSLQLTMLRGGGLNPNQFNADHWERLLESGHKLSLDPEEPNLPKLDDSWLTPCKERGILCCVCFQQSEGEDHPPPAPDPAPDPPSDPPPPNPNPFSDAGQVQDALRKIQDMLGNLQIPENTKNSEPTEPLEGGQNQDNVLVVDDPTDIGNNDNIPLPLPRPERHTFRDLDPP